MKIEQYMAYNGFGTNVYLAWDEYTNKAFLIDPGSKLDKCVQSIKDKSLDLKYIILTHGHGDHTGGLEDFKAEFPDAQVVAGRRERKMLYDRHMSMGKGGIKADIEVTDGSTLDVGTMHLEYIECPGHTPGGISVLCDKILFAGDTLFFRSVGRTDFEGGDWDELQSSIRDKLFKLPEDTIVLPGHGEKTTIGYEQRYNPFV